VVVVHVVTVPFVLVVFNAVVVVVVEKTESEFFLWFFVVEINQQLLGQVRDETEFGFQNLKNQEGGHHDGVKLRVGVDDVQSQIHFCYFELF
jgi:hypothetical protein